MTDDEKARRARAEMPVTGRKVYLNTGTAGPLARVTLEALEAGGRFDYETGRGTFSSFPVLLKDIERMRAGFAALMGASEEEVALTHHTTDGVNIVAHGLAWQAGDEIVTTSAEHEGGLLPLYVQKRRHGAVIKVVDIGHRDSPDEIAVNIGRAIGWENCALILAILILAVAFPLSYLIRNRPEDMGLQAEGASTPQQTRRSTAAQAAQPQGLTAQQAVRTPAFWLIALGHGMTSMIILAIFTHLGLLLKDVGLQEYAGTVVILYTIISMFAQPLGGYIGDRFPKRIGLFVFTTIQASAVVLLTFSTELWMFYAFAVIFGLGFGGRNPLTTSIRGEYFGRGNFGKILGISTIPMNGLLLISSPFAGYMYDWLGTYTIAFLVLAGFNYAGGVCFLFAKRPQIPTAPAAAVPVPAPAPAGGDS